MAKSNSHILSLDPNNMTPHKARWQMKNNSFTQNARAVNKLSSESPNKSNVLSPKTPSNKKFSVLTGKYCSVYRKSPCELSSTKTPGAKKNLKTPTHSNNKVKTPTRGCRFIPNRSQLDREFARFQLSSSEDEPEREEALNLSTTRILSFQPAKGPRPEDSHGKTGTIYSQSSAELAKQTRAKFNRQIPTHQDKILDAPGVKNDFYLNCLDWNQDNVVVIPLENEVYLWNAGTSIVMKLNTEPTSSYVSSVKWSPFSPFLAVGTSSAQVELWDARRQVRLRVMDGHDSRVGSLSWNGHTLTTGSRDGTLCHHDVRAPNHLYLHTKPHEQEICGLAWSGDGQYLATGGNDNTVCVYNSTSLESPLHRLTEHTAAVKGIVWCPWQPSLLTTGGGTSDRFIRFWNASNGKCLSGIQTQSQISSLAWNQEYKELVSGHGFANNEISVWKYPSLSKLADLHGHTNRVLNIALSPDETSVASIAADETLRIWKIFPHKEGLVKCKKMSPSTEFDKLRSIR